MTAIEIPPKRKKLYEFIFKIMSLKKAEDEKFEINIENLNEFKLITANLLEYFDSLLIKLVKSLYDLNKKINIVKKIDNLEFFKEIRSRISDEKLELPLDLRASLLEIIETDIKDLIKPVETRREISNNIFIEHLNKISEILENIKSKINLKIRAQEKSKIKNEENLTEILNLLEKIDQIYSFSEALPFLKEFSTSLYSKNSSYIYSQLKKSYNNKKIDDKQANIIFNEQLKTNFLEAILLFCLSNFGNLSVNSLHEKTKIHSSKIFASLLSLIEKGLIIEVEKKDNQPLYSSNLLGNQLARSLENLKDKLNSYRNKFGEPINKLIEKRIISLNELIKLASSLIKIDMNIYEADLEILGKTFNEIDSILPKSPILDEDLKFKIDSMIEAYKMYRLPLVVEKDENLQQFPEDEAKLSQTFEILLNQDYLKGKIIWAIKKFGPLNIVELEAKTNITKSQLFILLNILRMNEEIIIKDSHTEYQVFDIPRKISLFEKFLRTFISNLLEIKQNLNQIKDISKNLEKNIFEINDLINKVKGSFFDINNLTINNENIFQNDLIDLFKRTEVFNKKFLNLRSRVTIGERELDFSKLVPIKITKADENYSFLIQPDEIIGFGTIDSDEKKCISCGKCERVCPEYAAHLEKKWNLSLLFDMNDDEINALPENRRDIIFLIKKLAKKRPSEIKLPDNVLGFGKSVFDPVKCIACKECLEKCPNDAINFEEVWNIPEIVKNLSTQKMF